MPKALPIGEIIRGKNLKISMIAGINANLGQIGSTMKMKDADSKCANIVIFLTLRSAGERP